jgi:hypothetical protein
MIFSRGTPQGPGVVTHPLRLLIRAGAICTGIPVALHRFHAIASAGTFSVSCDSASQDFVIDEQNTGLKRGSGKIYRGSVLLQIRPARLLMQTPRGIDCQVDTSHEGHVSTIGATCPLY